jgi:hypothetical protein
MCLFFCCGKQPINDKIMIEKIAVYNDFYKAGTSASLRDIFNNPLDYEVDTSYIKVKHGDVDIFEFILNSADVRKHKQMKVNVDLALVVTIHGKEHFFIISGSSGMIVDLTANLNYSLNTDVLKKKTKEFIQKYN